MQANLITCVAAALALGAPSPPPADEDASEIRRLIPAASAMAREDFEKLAKAETTPKASDVEEKSLTLMLLALSPRDDKNGKEEFQYLPETSVPAPWKLAREIYRAKRIVGDFRLLLGPVTFIHADRITNFTCEVDGDTATGTVSFEVPELYRGKVNYVARHKDGKWQIAEFIMPAHGIHVVRNTKGIWQEKKAPRTPTVKAKSP